MLYKKVMQDLRSRINSDEFEVGDTLPTEKALSEHYGVSRVTIRNAIDELVELGLVAKRQGAGTSIIGKTVVGSLLTLKSTNEYFSSTNTTLEYKIDEFSLIDPDEELVRLLKVEKTEKVYFIRRFKLLNGKPSVYEESYMPASLYPRMNVMSLEGSKYRYLEEELGLDIDGASQDFEAILPSESMCRILDIDPSTPLLQVLSIGLLKDGRVFEYTKLVSLPGTMSYKHYLKRGE
ncbi:GntR family transcriptional regulator [Salinivibrio sp. ML323]|uniref:GntR family transcriptional regulator n=1 Tax=Salinivibrio sp. ML323 TaxID=1909474 RepID=UPI000984FE38|nr:GntR family transcriptional regulator [Salinivibrio sp. ML323]OOE59440.1 GntR family transcriptional regulator [Salinivibrio sp. ML323]